MQDQSTNNPFSLELQTNEQSILPAVGISGSGPLTMERLSFRIKCHEPGFTLITRHRGQKQRKTDTKLVSIRRRKLITNDSLTASAVIRKGGRHSNDNPGCRSTARRKHHPSNTMKQNSETRNSYTFCERWLILPMDRKSTWDRSLFAQN